MTDPTPFRMGTLVRYVPYHAEGNILHEDCELGIVTSVNGPLIFVRFTGKQSSQACNEDQLVIE
jgi:hypothetical protein